MPRRKRPAGPSRETTVEALTCEKDHPWNL